MCHSFLIVIEYQIVNTKIHSLDMGLALQYSLLFASAPCQCLPLVDEIRGRSLNSFNLVSGIIHHRVHTVAKYCNVYGRYNSPPGHNALFCAHINFIIVLTTLLMVKSIL